MTTNNFPPIALGTWSWGNGAVGGNQVFGNHLDKEMLQPVFDEAMKLGLNLWDTATVYGMGASEDILGAFVQEVSRKDILLSTKFTPQLAKIYDNSMMKMLDASLKRLNTDYIDIYWIHNPMDVERWTPQLIEVLKSGKVTTVGVSNHNLAQIERAEEILSKEGYHIGAIQNHYSLLYRESEEAGIIEWCNKRNVPFFAYMVLEQGALSGKYDTSHPLPTDSMRGQTYNPQLGKIEKLVAVMRGIADAHNVEVAQIPVAWAVAKHTLPLIGATKPSHVADAYNASQVKLTEEEIKLLEDAAASTGAETRGSWENSMLS